MFRTHFISRKSCRYAAVCVCVFCGLFPYWVHSIEQRLVQKEIPGLIRQYYGLYNQHRMVEADQIVDHRLKHISENGAVQQFLIRDEVLFGARRLEHQLKYLTDYDYIQTPDEFHIQITDGAAVASFLLTREKRLKEDGSVIERLQFRVTWVLEQKQDEWVVLHEHQSHYSKSSDE